MKPWRWCANMKPSSIHSSDMPIFTIYNFEMTEVLTVMCSGEG